MSETAPTFSIVTPVFNPPTGVFEDTIESVLGQTDGAWEWVIVDDCSTSPSIRPLLTELSNRDPRVRVVFRDRNGGIVAASNDGINAASGEYIVLLDHDDMLERIAIAQISEAVAAHPEADYLYSDEVVVDGSRIVGTFDKPDWSPERLRHQMYTSHVSVMRTKLVREVGGFRAGFDGSQDHDLVLRVSEQARLVWHIPQVLYRWRIVEGSTADAKDQKAKTYAWDAGVRAVTEHMRRTGRNAVVTKGAARGYYSVYRELDSDVAVSVVIPTRGSGGSVRGVDRHYVLEAVRSLLEHTAVNRVEIIVVYDLTTPDEVLAGLREIAGESLVLVPFSESFNFSRKCNVGFLHATGDYIVFLNDDTEAYTDYVLEELIAPLSEPGVGMTGPRLLFEDTRIQGAGVVYGSGAIHPGHYRMAQERGGHFGALWVNRETSALTGACVALRREVFETVGGFSEDLPLNYNDVDLSFKVRGLGLSLLWLHRPTLFHYESATRDSSVQTWEWKAIQARWGSVRSDRERFGLKK